MTILELIKMLDTNGNKYGGATGKPRKINIDIPCINAFLYDVDFKIDGSSDGIITDLTLQVSAYSDSYVWHYFDTSCHDIPAEDSLCLVVVDERGGGVSRRVARYHAGKFYDINSVVVIDGEDIYKWIYFPKID